MSNEYRDPDPRRYWYRPRNGALLHAVSLLADGEHGWMRRCPDCREWKSIRAFGLRNVDGVVYDQPKCGECRSKRQEETREAL
jgi:ssDNA-binding Zn-finger/Zn-ribbon topoisomerase 1